MNIIELQDNLKDVSDDVLMKEMQMPSGNAPQFLVLSELKRRKRMRDEYQRQQAADIPTVAEEVVTGAGVPQQGIMQAARAMAPNTNMAQNTGMNMAAPVPATRAPQQPQMMADGGVVTMREGGAISAQPTGQGGTYILMQDGERVSGTGIYPDFRSADQAAKALRGTQSFETQRTLDEPAPVLQEEISELSKVSPDPMAFAANDEIRRQLQLRQAMGDFRDAEVGGITSLDPFGRAFMDEYRPDLSEMEGIPSGGEGVQDVMSYMRLNPLDPPLTRDTLPENVRLDGLRFSRGTASSNAVNDAVVGGDVTDALGRRLFDENRPTIERDTIESPTTEEELANALGFAVEADQRNELLEKAQQQKKNLQKRLEQLNAALGAQAQDVAGSELPIRGSDTKASQELAEFLASRRSDVPGANLPGESDPYIIDRDAAKKQGQAILDSLTPPPTGQQNNPNIDGPLSSALQYYGGTAFKGAATDEPTAEEQMLAASGALTANYADPEEKQSILSSLFSNPLLDLNKGDTTTEDVIAPKADEDRSNDPLVTIGSEARKSAEEALQNQEESFDQPDSFAVIDTITDGGEDGAGFGSIDSRIAKMIADREKKAESDKWMSLAQAGMALMASKNPTFGGALGEAGQAGLKSLRESQKGRDAFETDMLKLQTQLDIAKERTGASRYSADQAFKAQQLSTKARSEATQQRLSAQTDSGLSDLIAIYDNQLAELGVISGQAPPAAVADRYNQIIRERQAVIDELERRVGANVAATGGSELSGQFNVTQ